MGFCASWAWQTKLQQIAKPGIGSGHCICKMRAEHGTSTPAILQVWFGTWLLLFSYGGYLQARIFNLAFAPGRTNKRIPRAYPMQSDVHHLNNPVRCDLI